MSLLKWDLLLKWKKIMSKADINDIYIITLFSYLFSLVKLKVGTIMIITIQIYTI